MALTITVTFKFELEARLTGCAHCLTMVMTFCLTILKFFHESSAYKPDLQWIYFGVKIILTGAVTFNLRAQVWVVLQVTSKKDTFIELWEYESCDPATKCMDGRSYKTYTYYKGLRRIPLISFNHSVHFSSTQIWKWTS